MTNHGILALAGLACAASLIAAQTPSPALLIVDKEGALAIVNPATREVAAQDPRRREADRIDWLLGTGLDGTHLVRINKAMDQIYTANIDSNAIGIFDRRGSEWVQTSMPVGKGRKGSTSRLTGRNCGRLTQRMAASPSSASRESPSPKPSRCRRSGRTG